jgi:alpha-methylacyl-CoA racemase
MGPLHGLKIIEIAGIGPGPFCGMLLADMGAQVIRVGRADASDPAVEIPARFNLMNRSRPTITADLKSRRGVELVLRLCDDADAIFEGFRPGVMEKLGLGPDACFARNERIVYGRLTGWGQDGPLSGAAGHDTNYIALAGALHGIGPGDRPPPVPLNLIGDFGGGALYLAMGMLAALLEAQKSGQGQVVDAAMVDGAASMLTLFYGLLANGRWVDERESNLLDGGAPFVRCYETSDQRFIAVCAIESRFFGNLLEAMGIQEIVAEDQYRVESWREQVAIFTRAFATRTRDQWSEILDGADACAAPVLSLTEAPLHPHNAARGTFVRVDGVQQPGPAPRFSRTPSGISQGPAAPTEDRAVLAAWGLADDEIAELI